MKKILSIFTIYGILSNVNAQGWSESFNIDAANDYGKPVSAGIYLYQI